MRDRLKTRPPRTSSTTDSAGASATIPAPATSVEGTVAESAAAPVEETAEERRARRLRTTRDALRELLLVAALFLVYKLGRGLAGGEDSKAIHNAREILTLQQDLRLPDEQVIQHWFTQSDVLISAANKYYAWVHFPVTVAFLLWLWIRHRDHYKWIRNLLAIMTGIALVIHILVPLAPPRLMKDYGFVDTGMLDGSSPYAGAGAKIANQYAAMPSLHFGWALVVAIGVMAVWCNRDPLRRAGSRLIWLHPAITLLVVVVTANHYWLDAFVASLLLAVAMLIVPFPDRSPHAKLVRIIPAPRVPVR
ncbi:phosphatase PAP2 family protein [Yinghuangia seranimata]|uniref:phosphatase PAP2 family protein n=1 Tax=Yinghuangia seranimata TaxID=408067 RepID=UPI00248C38CE|nr:phosphatase PAP2 family protein [Yinghuangia seranimata]MDI2131501.1 phosphatase PAP2 family protein [Yinghuangia seranimata]